MVIESGTKLTGKKRKASKREKSRNISKNTTEPGTAPGEGSSQKRVHFDLTQNKVTQFFKHGKVATKIVSGRK